MGMEEDLINMLKYMNIPGVKNINDAVLAMMRGAQVSSLRRLRAQLDEMISQLEPGPTDTGLDPFSILGVSMDASEEEVKKAFREKAFSAHPDRGGSNEEMVKVNAAMEVIRRIKGWS